MNEISLSELVYNPDDPEAWIYINGVIFEVSDFIKSSPLAKNLIQKKDSKSKSASVKYKIYKTSDILKKYGENLKIGVLQTPNSYKDQSELFSETPRKFKKFGDQIPYGDPSWYQGWPTPYYNESHVKWRAKAREFTETYIIPNVKSWEENYKIPPEIFRKAGELGFLAASVGSTWPKEFDGPCPENFDLFHAHILNDEIARCGAGGVPWGIFGGLSIGLPPIINFGSDKLKAKVVKDCLEGKKIICLCISEPKAASDVAGIKTTAVENGDYFIVNGTKKWITNGTYADLFTVACKTSNEKSRINGISLLLIDKNMKGITRRHMKCQGVWSSGTAFIEFDNVKVPKENLIGKKNYGFQYIMYNFNHERRGFAAQSIRLSRMCYEKSFLYSIRRETFNKKLCEHQTIRMKLADMTRQIESCQAWIESITYQWTKMTEINAMKVLGESIALLKVQSTKVLDMCAREAMHIFGGAGYVMSGVGEMIERIYRDVIAFAIPGGAEEILSDFSVRASIKKYLKAKL